MGEKHGQSLLLSVIGVATLLVAIVGATFAWFSTTMTGTGGSASVTTASVSSLSLDGISITAGNQVLPGWESAESEFTVSGSVSGNVQVPYECNITSTTESGKATLTDLEYKVSTADSATNNGTWTKVSAATKISGTISSTNGSDKYLFQIRLPETGENQNTQQNGQATVSVSCALQGNTIYYTTASPNGTTTEPSAN